MILILGFTIGAFFAFCYAFNVFMNEHTWWAVPFPVVGIFLIYLFWKDTLKVNKKE